MTATRFFCFSLALLPLSASQNILADEKPQLPKQYAEVVLHVEGMVWAISWPLAVEEAQAGLPGVLQVTVRFKEKDATVRYLPGKVGLTQILKRYDDTPFDVTADKPIVSVVRTKTATLRGWTVRKKTPKASGVKKLDPISVHVEIVPTKGTRISSAVNISMSNPPAARLKSRDAFRSTKVTGKPTAVQFMATIIESSRLKPGDSIIPVGYQLSTLSTGEKPEKLAGTFHVILRTLPSAPADNAVAGTGVALIGGILDLRLGHLCDQRGCVSHLHKSLAAIPGVAGMSPHPDLKGRNSATGALR